MLNAHKFCIDFVKQAANIILLTTEHINPLTNQLTTQQGMTP